MEILQAIRKAQTNQEGRQMIIAIAVQKGGTGKTAIDGKAAGTQLADDDSQ